MVYEHIFNQFFSWKLRKIETQYIEELKEMHEEQINELDDQLEISVQCNLL